MRATERVGHIVDKERLKKALEAMMQRQSATLRGQQQKRPRSEALERLKFWLGMPNSYYQSDWQVPAEGSSEEEFDVHWEKIEA